MELSSSVCRACRGRLLSAVHGRPFSTISSRRYIPPESPAFVDVPEPHQSIRDRLPRFKGTLPLAREIFPANRPDKPSAPYLANATRDRLPKNVPAADRLSATGAHKLRLAALRKQYLRQSLPALRARKTAADAETARRSTVKQQENERLRRQADREDARLTNVSIPAAMRPQPVQRLSPEAEHDLYAARHAAHAARAAVRHDDRLEKLHTLYMHARHFITSKEQLADAIETAFTTTRSIWRTGRPDTVEEMMKRGRDRSADTGRGGMMLATDVNERAVRDQERMKQIAEKLSGGKI